MEVLHSEWGIIQPQTELLHALLQLEVIICKQQDLPAPPIHPPPTEMFVRFLHHHLLPVFLLVPLKPSVAIDASFDTTLDH